MKKQNLLFVIFILLVFATAWWLQTHRSKSVAPVTQVANTPASNQQNTASSGTIPKVVQNQRPQPTTASNPTAPADVLEFVRKTRIDPDYEWRQPINFYGRVVDESNTPVVDAGIHFTWNDLSPKGTSDADTRSDGNGFFSLTEQKGKRLYVTVGKDGYYSSGNSKNSAFEYANPADGLFTPDQNNPVVFHLRKKGVGVDLITSQYGMKPYLGVSAPLDGKPVFADILNRQVGQTGQIQISQIKPVSNHWKEATEWQFRMTISNGGFLEENDEFPFEAPEEGYQSTVEFDFQQGQSDWAINLKKDYYIKFGNPPKYGRLHVETQIDMGGARLTYAINPDGSRNLEPK